jgi:hypothetical protein
MAISLDDVMLDLSYLLGETSVPTPSPADRQAFIQRTLERVYRQYDFDLAKTTATVTLTNGTGTLPTDLGLSKDLDVRKIVGTVGASTGDDLVFDSIPYEQQDEFGNGDYKYWVTGSPGSYTLNTTESGNTNLTAVTIRYTQKNPTISSTLTTPFPSSMCLARGALVYYRQAEDPQSDISQLEALFQRELEEVISTQIRNQPDRPSVTRHQTKGTYTGDIT